MKGFCDCCGKPTENSISIANNHPAGEFTVVEILLCDDCREPLRRQGRGAPDFSKWFKERFAVYFPERQPEHDK
jgi:hypothetical protein